MYRNLFIALFITILNSGKLNAKIATIVNIPIITIENDTSRNSALDQYWNEVSRTVNAGDFEGYSALYHEDAVVVFATGKNKTSLSISKALSGWKQGFMDTKAGKADSNVLFRLSQRINDESTAHETGIFHYSSLGDDGNVKVSSYIHFEMLLVKKKGRWLGVMEYQKSKATQEEWDALE